MKEKFLAHLKFEVIFLEQLNKETLSGGMSTNNVDKINEQINYLKQLYFDISQVHIINGRDY